MKTFKLLIMKKLTKILLKLSVLFSVIAMILIIASSCEEKPTKVQLHRKQVESLFYYSGGPHKTAFSYVQKQLNDPESLENIDCVWVEDTTTNIITVHWEFSAKNAFGGRLREYVVFDSDTLGNIVKVHKWVE